MAMYHLSTKVIKRSEGRSAVGASAYRSASKMVDDRTGKSFNYSKKQGVLETGCFMMNSDRTLTSIDRETLWNVAEKTERRKDSRTAREIIVNLPHELPHQERKKIVERFSSVLMHRYGVAVDWAMHAPDKQGDQRNYHAHIMLTTREISLENGQIKLGKRTDLEQANKDLKKQNKDSTQDQIKTLRRDFADITNAILSENNIDARIDHRSYKDRGLYVLPTQKMGYAATEAERAGIRTHKGDINRAIQAYNDAITEYYAPLVVNDIEIYNLSDLYRAGVIIDEFQPPAPTPKPKPASAPVVHHAPPPAQPAPQSKIPSLDEFEASFAQSLESEIIAPVPAPPPAHEQPQPPSNDGLDSKHSIKPQNQAQTTEILRLPASFFYSDTTYGVKVMAEIGHYGRYAQGSESLGHVGIHEFDSRSMLRTTFDYDATNQKIININGLDAYLRDRISHDTQERAKVEKAMIDGLQQRAQFLQENDLNAYEQHIKSTLKTHFNIAQSATTTTAERTTHQRNNDRDFDR